MSSVKWKITLSGRARKQLGEIPITVRANLVALLKEMELLGPIRGSWKNYSKLGRGLHHCHLKSGRPTYVACWRELNGNNREIEVFFIGTHERAPY